MTTASHTLTLDAERYEDHDDCLAAAERDVQARLGLARHDLSPRWGDNRETIEITVPGRVAPEISRYDEGELLDRDPAIEDDAIVLVDAGWTASDGEEPMHYPCATSAHQACQAYVDTGDWAESCREVHVSAWRRGVAINSDGSWHAVRLSAESHDIEVTDDARINAEAVAEVRAHRDESEVK